MYTYIGTIMPWAGSFAPYGWAFCQGQTLAIQNNQGLFMVLGNRYGGDGKTNFKLPDLRGMVPMGFGQGTGLSNRTLAIPYGEAGVTLAVSQIPSHSHTANVTSNQGNQNTPIGNIPAATGGGSSDLTFSTTTDGSSMNTNAIQMTGQSQAHPNYQPSLVVNYIIATAGEFPSMP